jgi:cyclic pyranopterin phosphate synthase
VTVVEGLVDGFGRTATDLRVSLTDRCNLRCTYCMPAEGLDWLENEKLLTDDEVVRLVRIAVTHLGVDEVRFTGGEPLVRRGIVDIVRRSAALEPRPRLSITTNGLGLTRTAQSLADAGLDRVNVSLDTVRRETFAQMTLRDRLPDVVSGLAAASAAGLRPVKINAVLMRGVNDSQAAELLRWCLERGYELRFIEQMPLDAQHGWRRDDMVTAAEILDLLTAEFDLTDAEEPRGSAPAELFTVNGGPATVGVIASVTRPFCGDCDRVRLTADGQVRNCLFAREESDLRGAMRAGVDDVELADRWRARSGRATASTTSRSSSPPGRCPRSAAEPPLARGSERAGLLEEPAGTEERTQRLPVLRAGQPLLPPVRCVQLGVVPQQRPCRRLLAPFGRAGQRLVRGVQCSTGRSLMAGRRAS